MNSSFILILINILLAVSGQTFIKQGVAKVGDYSTMPVVLFFQQALLSPFVILGVLLYILSSFVWFLVLSKLDLSIAYPALSLGYILVLAIGVFYLNEPLTFYKLLGVIFICLGTFLVFHK